MKTNTVSTVFDGKPYIFLSYAHDDYSKIIPIATMLQEEGFRVWFDNESDEGLNPGDAYRTVITKRIKDCAVILSAISRVYCRKEFCVREFNVAVEYYKKPFVPVYLEDPDKLEPYYTQGIEFWLNGKTGFVYKKDTDLSELRKQVHKIDALRPCNRAYDDFLPQNQQAEEIPDDEVPAIEGNPENHDERTESNRKNSPAVKRLLEIVQKDIKAKRFADAQQGLDSIFEEDPNNPDARYYQLLVKYRVTTPEELGRLPFPLDSTEVRAAALFQSKERSRVLEDALNENKNYQQYIVGTAYMKDGNYQAAIRVLSTIQDFRDSGPKIATCREAIAQNELNEAYKKEVGDGKLYLSEQLRLKKPDQYQEYGKLCNEVGHEPSSSIVFLVLAIALVAAGGGLFVMPESKVLFWCSVVFSVVFGFFCWFIHPLAGIGVIGVCLLLLFKFKAALAIIMLIFGACSLAMAISDWKSNRRYKKALDEKESYYRQYIKDFEEAERTAIDVKYAGIPEAARKPLLSIEEAFRLMRTKK